MDKQNLDTVEKPSSVSQPFFKGVNSNLAGNIEAPFFKPVAVSKKISSEVIQRDSKERYEYRDGDDGTAWDYFLGAVAGGVADLAGSNGAFSVAYFGLDEGLPRKLLLNYTYGGGNTYKLNKSEMRECIPGLQILIYNDPNYKKAKTELLKTQKEVSYDSKFSFTASMPGTLNMFTIFYSAKLSTGPKGEILLNGYMFFYDIYDFDYHAGGRSEVGQYKTGFGRMIPGNKFAVTSEIVRISSVNNSVLAW